MDVLASSEFRRQYGKLSKPTVVTVNGHRIGVWTPDPLVVYDPAIRQITQAQRDDLLRKINRQR